MRQGALWIALLVVAGLVLTLLASQQGQNASGPSSLSAASTGWLAARRYLEGRGATVELLDRPPGAEVDGVLVTAFPWPGWFANEGPEALADHLERGGTLVLAYDGKGISFAEATVLDRLGLSTRQVRNQAPLSYRAWRRHVTATAELAPPDGGQPVVVAAPQWAPEVPEGAEVLYRDRAEGVAVFVDRRRRGRLVVLPADAWSNARLEQGANADLLESLLAAEGERKWWFDEYHHGLRAEVGGGARGASTALLSVLGQVVLLYLLGIVAVGRRFGPAWREPPLASASSVTFLRGLGVLHGRRGHFREAARRLVELVERIDPQRALPEGVSSAADSVATGEELLRVARWVARSRRRGAVQRQGRTSSEEAR